MLVPFVRTDPEQVPVSAIEVVKEGSPATPGEMATFTVTVRNTGSVPLTEVSIDDDEDAVCGNSFDQPLPPGLQRTYTCHALVEDYSPSGTVTVTAMDPQNNTVRASYDTKVIVHRQQAETVAPQASSDPDLLASPGVELEPLPLFGLSMVLLGVVLLASGRGRYQGNGPSSS